MWKDELGTKGSCGALEPPGEAQEENKKYPTDDTDSVGNDGGRMFCSTVPDADCLNDYEFVYVLVRDCRELRTGVCHNGFGRQGIYFIEGKFEIYSGYGIVQPVCDGSV